MKQLLITFLCVLLNCATLLAGNINGKILDAENKPIIGATVVLLENMDSTMVSFAISDESGDFQLRNVGNGQYVLQLSFVSYATKQIAIEVINKADVDLGILEMQFVAETLKEVSITADHIPLGILGDTISYNAAAFKTRPGATVEDLLRKMPGIDVERDGTIKAMGKEVENVLVEGKEFFGSDPKIATQNLEAEAVDKVQVFDKKSEIASFTGVDDGVEEKTLNLKLKEEYKKGGFGKVEAMAGTEDRYKLKGNYNRFSPSTQASLLMGTNNINEQSFSFNEYIDFMGGIGNAIGSMGSTNSFGFGGSSMTPQGNTDNLSTGVNLNHEFNSKWKVNGHYFFVRSDLDKRLTSRSSEFSDIGEFTTRSNSILDERTNNHRVKTKVRYNANPFTRFIANINIDGFWNDNKRNSQTNFLQNTLSTGLTTSLSESDYNSLKLKGSLEMRKKYKKKGRSWITKVSHSNIKHDEEENVRNDFDYPTFNSLVNQTQNNQYNSNVSLLSSAFTEPIGENYYLKFRYHGELEKSDPERRYFDRINGTRILNNELSTGYDLNIQVHRPTISLRRNSKILKTVVGSSWQHSVVEGLRSDTTGVVKNTSKFLLPFMSFDWKISSKTSMEVHYNSSVRLPKLDELAPFVDNTSANRVLLGNQNLLPEYKHVLSLNVHYIDRFNFTNFFGNISFRYTKDAIINAVGINEDLLKTYQPINTDNRKTVHGSMSFSTAIRPIGIKFRTRISSSFSTYATQLNQVLSQANDSRSSIKLTVENKKKKNFDIATGIDLSYNTNRYELNNSFDQNYFNYAYFVDASWYISEDLTISSVVDFIHYSGEFFAMDRNYTLWNASILKTFKDKKIGIKVEVFDILGQNVGVTRSGGLNALHEQEFNTLSQYFGIGGFYKIGRKKKSAIEISEG